MQSLLSFIGRFYGFFLFVFLEVLCVLILINNSNFHRASFFSSSNSIIGDFYNFSTNVRDYFNLKYANESLAEENAKLKAALNDAQYHNRYEVYTRKNLEYEQLYTYIPAKIINNSVNKLNNYIVLNKGKLQNITSEMGVISENGIIGIVISSSQHYSSVMSILHKDIRLSAKLKSSNLFGSISWKGKDPAIVNLDDIPQHVIVKKGDTIVTSGFSAIFPADITIGFIANYTKQPGTNFYNIEVKLATNMQQAKYVYIVNHLMKEEINSIQEDDIENND